MRLVYFHEDDGTLAYNLDDINPTAHFIKGQVVQINIGASRRHPKDPPNRKIGNVVAAGRLGLLSTVVHDISEGRDGVQILLGEQDSKVRIVLFKRHENKNFYIVGFNIA